MNVHKRNVDENNNLLRNVNTVCKFGATLYDYAEFKAQNRIVFWVFSLVGTSA